MYLDIGRKAQNFPISRRRPCFFLVKPIRIPLESVYGVYCWMIGSAVSSVIDGQTDAEAVALHASRIMNDWPAVCRYVNQRST